MKPGGRQFLQKIRKNTYKILVVKTENGIQIQKFDCLQSSPAGNGLWQRKSRIKPTFISARLGGQNEAGGYWLVREGRNLYRVNLSTGQWVYLYTFFSKFRVQNRGEICKHKRSKQEWNLYTKVQGKGGIYTLSKIYLPIFTKEVQIEYRLFLFIPIYILFLFV